MGEGLLYQVILKAGQGVKILQRLMVSIAKTFFHAIVSPHACPHEAFHVVSSLFANPSAILQ
jgi:hypothetical protein